MSGSKHHNPYRDWFVIVCFFFCVTVVVLVFAIALYYEIDHDTIFRNTLNSENPVPKIDRQAIESVSGYYKEQEKVLRELTAGTSTAPSAVDPSL